MKKVKFNGNVIYIDDTPLNENETGKIINKKEELDKTLEIDKSLIDKMINSWSDDNEWNQVW